PPTPAYAAPPVPPLLPYTTLFRSPEIATRIAAYETAFRMQASVPELIDISDEPQHVLDLYGTRGADGSFAGNCLLARRLAERGVDRKSIRLNSSHVKISYAVFCLR